MKWILSLFLMAGTLSVLAQQFTVTHTSNKQEAEPRVLRFGAVLFSLNTDMSYTSNLKKAIHSIEIVKYDTTMKLVKSTKVSNGEKLYGPIQPLLKEFANKLYLLYCLMPEEGKVQFFSAEVDPISLHITGATQVLDMNSKERFLERHIGSVINYHPNRFAEKHLNGIGIDYPYLLHKTFFSESSPDGSKIVLLWNSGWDNRVFFSVLDKGMKKIRTGETEVPDEVSLSLNSACVDNLSNIYIAYSYEKKGKGYASLVVNTTNGKTSVNEVRIPGGEPYGVFATIGNDERIYLNGAYKESSWNLAGVFIQSLNPADMQLSTVSKTVFPKELVEIFDNEEWASIKGKNYGISARLVLESYKLENGTMGLIGEFRFTRFGDKTVVNYTGSILSARFIEKKAIFSRIPRMRTTHGGIPPDSYSLLEYKNKLVVLYNDYVSNVKLDLSKTPTSSDKYSNSVLVAATIDENGSIQREIVLDESDGNFVSLDRGRQPLSATSYFVTLCRIKGKATITNDLKWVILDIK